jgi:hypothetical protein
MNLKNKELQVTGYRLPVTGKKQKFYYKLKKIQMKNIKSVTVIFLLTTLISCEWQIYQSSNFKSSGTTVKTFAFLPFDVAIDSGRGLPKGITLKTLKEYEKKMGYDIQSKTYKLFVYKQKGTTAAFQDVDQTNAILAKANIQYNRIATENKSELCKLLGVDAVISCKFLLSTSLYLYAESPNPLDIILEENGRKLYEAATWTIHDTQGELLWNFNGEQSDYNGEKALTESLIWEVVKEFSIKTKDFFHRVYLD